MSYKELQQDGAGSVGWASYLCSMKAVETEICKTLDIVSQQMITNIILAWVAEYGTRVVGLFIFVADSTGTLGNISFADQW